MLSELFTLLELPRDAVSLRAERLLLDAIHSHRAERAITAARSLAEALAKVVALVRNDSSAADAAGTLRLAPHEAWSAGAMNQTLQGLLPDVLALMDASANETDTEAWARMLHVANLTNEQVRARGAPPPPRPPLALSLCSPRAEDDLSTR